VYLAGIQGARGVQAGGLFGGIKRLFLPQTHTDNYGQKRNYIFPFSKSRHRPDLEKGDVFLPLAARKIP
jgi:hypothetical protein